MHRVKDATPRGLEKFVWIDDPGELLGRPSSGRSMTTPQLEERERPPVDGEDGELVVGRGLEDGSRHGMLQWLGAGPQSPYL
jgi:hypothetical protein